MLKAVARNGTIETEATILPEQYQETQIQDKERNWVEKKMYGQYAREMGNGVDMERTWRRLKKSDLKGCTEGLICSAWEQALRTNYTKYHIDKIADSPSCRMCGEKGESVVHLVSECSKLTQKVYVSNCRERVLTFDHLVFMYLHQALKLNFYWEWNPSSFKTP